MSSQSSLIPAKHRDKLRILVILKGYSYIACGKGMKVLDQQIKLNKYVYGKQPNKVSNLELLVIGLSDYSDLYEKAVYPSINKDGKKWMDKLPFRRAPDNPTIH